MVNTFTQCLFGRCVIWGAQNHAGLSKSPPRLLKLDQAKVGQQWPILAGQKNVGRFYIAVNDALLVA